MVIVTWKAYDVEEAAVVAAVEAKVTHRLDSWTGPKSSNPWPLLLLISNSCPGMFSGTMFCFMLGYTYAKSCINHVQANPLPSSSALRQYAGYAFPCR